MLKIFHCLLLNLLKPFFYYFLARHLENLGASIKSFSDREKVVFELTVLPDKLESALELLSESLKFKLKPLYLVRKCIYIT